MIDGFLAAEQAVELVLSEYDGLAGKVSKREHHERIAEIYGEYTEGEPVSEQLRSQGMVIAVLYWKLAQARGLIPA